MKRVVLAALLALAAASTASAAAQPVDFSDAELRAILRHGPWPAPWSPDPSNRVSGDSEAIELGERLFFEPRLSPSGKVLCATCHAPFRGFQDTRARAFGLAEVDRNTPSIFNARYNRWFGWDGAGDSLWAQSIRPILEPREMGGSQAQAAALLRGDPELSCRYEKIFGAPPPASDEAVLAGIGKALAAFQETIVTGRAPFDDFRDALEKGDRASAARYPFAAQRGLRIFVGKGNCSACHFGPTFSNGEFHDTGVPFFIKGGVDPGRHGGIKQAGGQSPQSAGRAQRRPGGRERDQDAAGRARAPQLRRVQGALPQERGADRTLHAQRQRGVVGRRRAPLFRARSRPAAFRRREPCKPLRLSAAESADLVAFLESLTESASALAPRRPSGAPCR